MDLLFFFNEFNRQCLDKLILGDLDPAIYLDLYLIHDNSCMIFLSKIFSNQ